MQLSQKALEEFKAIYKRKFDVELSDDLANENGTELALWLGNERTRKDSQIFKICH